MRRETEKNNFEVLDETDPGSILNGDTLNADKKKSSIAQLFIDNLDMHQE